MAYSYVEANQARSFVRLQEFQNDVTSLIYLSPAVAFMKAALFP